MLGPNQDQWSPPRQGTPNEKVDNMFLNVHSSEPPNSYTTFYTANCYNLQTTEYLFRLLIQYVRHGRVFFQHSLCHRFAISFDFLFQTYQSYTILLWLAPSLWKKRCFWFWVMLIQYIDNLMKTDVCSNEAKPHNPWRWNADRKQRVSYRLGGLLTGTSVGRNEAGDIRHHFFLCNVMLVFVTITCTTCTIWEGQLKSLVSMWGKLYKSISYFLFTSS